MFWGEFLRVVFEENFVLKFCVWEFGKFPKKIEGFLFLLK